ncbi:hypothetical protein C3460_11715 [Serratia marcescens]|nr:hypothetical protein C3462_13235 [Serratia marcescens]POX00951.1 hypothetical protein C3466_13255 [Serratia marcescens]POX14894.1 hypothetical protein C3460_11715 [Serratia marcescens]
MSRALVCSSVLLWCHLSSTSFHSSSGDGGTGTDSGTGTGSGTGSGAGSGGVPPPPNSTAASGRPNSLQMAGVRPARFVLFPPQTASSELIRSGWLRPSRRTLCCNAGLHTISANCDGGNCPSR